MLTNEGMHRRIVEAIRPIAAASYGTDHDGMADAAIGAFADWLDHIDQQVTESEAYRRGKDDGYAEAYRLFGPELESLRAKHNPTNTAVQPLPEEAVCDSDGWVIVNPEWPRGYDVYRERCAGCPRCEPDDEWT